MSLPAASSSANALIPGYYAGVRRSRWHFRSQRAAHATGTTPVTLDGLLMRRTRTWAENRGLIFLTSSLCALDFAPSLFFGLGLPGMLFTWHARGFDHTVDRTLGARRVRDRRGIMDQYWYSGYVLSVSGILAERNGRTGEHERSPA